MKLTGTNKAVAISVVCALAVVWASNNIDQVDDLTKDKSFF